jgi:prepilin peptidase CpaA
MTISTFAAPLAPVVFAFTMVYAGLTDLTTMKIRNSLVLLFLLAYAVLAPLLGFAAYDIGWSAVVAAGVLVFTSAVLRLAG